MAIIEYENKFKKWDSLSENERDFFVGDEYLPLPSDIAERISVIKGRLSRELSKELLANVPGISSNINPEHFSKEDICLENAWGNTQGTQQVREWLYKKGIPFSRTVYLVYDRGFTVKTDWKTVVKYWDAFAWSVGMAMFAIDSSKQWSCEFNHEDYIHFYRYLTN